jgi:tetratricopeptide (TPR) repeat protein
LAGLFVGWLAWILVRGEIVYTRQFGQSTGVGWLDLRSQLGSSNAQVRLAAAQRLAELGPVGRAAFPAVQQRLRLAQEAADGGWLLAYAVSQSGNEDLVPLAAAVIAGHEIAQEKFVTFGADDRAVALIQLLHDLDPAVESDVLAAAQIARWLGGSGSNARAETLADLALGSSGFPLGGGPPLSEAQATVAATGLLAFFHGRDLPDPVLASVVQLGAPASEALVAELERIGPDPANFSRRQRVYRAIRLLGPLARSAEPALQAAIQSESINLAFFEALLAMVAIDPVDRTTATELIRAANDPARWEGRGYSFEPISQACVTAIEDLGAMETIDGLIAEFQRRDPSLGRDLPAAGSRRSSWRIARKLGENGSRAHLAISALQDALQSYWPEVRLEAALALYRVGGSRDEALQVLLDFLDLDQNSPENVALALAALGEIEQIPAADLLIAFECWERLLSNGPTSEIRQMAADSLHRRAPNDDRVTEVLISALLQERAVAVRRTIRDLLALRTFADDPGLHTSLSIEQAVDWLKANWQADKVDSRSGEEELQVLLAQNLLRHRAAAAAVALANWLATDPNVPRLAVQLFDSLGPDRTTALPILVAALECDDPKIVDQCMLRIAALQGEALAAYDAVSAIPSRHREAALQRISPERYVRSTRLTLECVLSILLPILMLLLVGRLFWRCRGGDDDRLVPRNDLASSG